MSLSILELAPHIFVPLLVTLLFKQFHLTRKFFTYFITALLIVIYPFVLFSFEGYLEKGLTQTNCGNPQGLFVIGNTIIFLPIALLLQFVFNKIFLKRKNV